MRFIRWLKPAGFTPYATSLKSLKAWKMVKKCLYLKARAGQIGMSLGFTGIGMSC